MMGRINWGRVLLGGLLAGFVANVLQFTANRLFLFREWSAATHALGLSITRGTGHHFSLAIWNFVGGIFAVWLYAMIRSRFGLGLKPAVVAGGAFWLLSWLFPVVLWGLSGALPAVPVGLWATHLATYLLIAVVQTMAGAWPYKE